MQKFDRIVSFSVMEINNKPIFLIQVKTEEGDFINVYIMIFWESSKLSFISY